MTHDWGVVVPVDLSTETVVEIRDKLRAGTMTVELPDSTRYHEKYFQWKEELQTQMLAAYEREALRRRGVDMTDIVERLRGHIGDGPVPRLSDAADEIERLRNRLRENRCPVDVRGNIGECVDSGHCGCSNGLVLKRLDAP